MATARESHRDCRVASNWSFRPALLAGWVVASTALFGCGNWRWVPGQNFETSSEDPCNFVQNSSGQRVSWKDRAPIPIWIHDSVPEHLIPSIYSAFARWEYGVGRPLFRVAGIRSGAPEAEQDGESVIYWLRRWPGSQPREQARTTIYWVSDRLQEADVIVNAESHDFVAMGEISKSCSPADLAAGSSRSGCKGNEVDFESLIVHELGHVLGLQHNEAQGSVMARELPFSTVRVAPNSVDVASLSCEYLM